MTSSRRIKKIKIAFCLLWLWWILPLQGTAQEAVNNNSVFWEISGKQMQQPSYLFGTFHLMGSQYVDSLTLLVDKFNSCDNVVGELLIDSTMAVRMMTAAQLHGTTLDALLDSTTYSQTAIWLKELSGYDLMLFNSMNPMTIQIFLMSMLQQKYFPLNQSLELPMDIYFQQRAKKAGKNVIGLESFEIQMNALFLQFSPERQAEILGQFVKEKDEAKTELLRMNTNYLQGNLSKLEEMLLTETYTPGEIEIMLDNRNQKWMEQLPAIMKDGKTFIAVGALHLAGKNGLIALLQRAGYTLKPLRTR